MTHTSSSLSMMLVRTIAALLYVVALITCEAVAQQWAYTSASASGNYNWGGNLGLDFDVVVPVYVFQLGTFNNDAVLTACIDVGIFSRSSQLKVNGASLRLCGHNSTKSGLISHAPLRPFVMLPAGQYSIVGLGYDTPGPPYFDYGGPDGNIYGTAAYMNGNGCDPSSSAPVINFVGTSRFNGGGPLSYPTTVDDGPAARYAAGTFSFAPTYCPLVWLSASNNVSGTVISPGNVQVASWASRQGAASVAAGVSRAAGSQVVQRAGLRSFHAGVVFDGTGVLSGALPAPVATPMIFAVFTGGVVSQAGSNVLSCAPSGSFGVYYDGRVGADATPPCVAAANASTVLPTLVRVSYTSPTAVTVHVGAVAQPACGAITLAGPAQVALEVGGKTLSDPDAIFRGTVYELLLFPTSSEILLPVALESYLALKYGLCLGGATKYVDSLGSTVFSNTAPYDQSILALGRLLVTRLDQRVSFDSGCSDASNDAATSVLGLATSNEFTVANGDASRPPLAAGETFVCGSDGGALSFGGAWGAPSNRPLRVGRQLVRSRLRRVWRCDFVAPATRLYVCVSSAVLEPRSEFDDSAMSNRTLFLLIDYSTPTFTSPVGRGSLEAVPLVLGASGCWTNASGFTVAPAAGSRGQLYVAVAIGSDATPTQSVSARESITASASTTGEASRSSSKTLSASLSALMTASESNSREISISLSRTRSSTSSSSFSSTRGVSKSCSVNSTVSGSGTLSASGIESTSASSPVSVSDSRTPSLGEVKRPTQTHGVSLSASDSTHVSRTVSISFSSASPTRSASAESASQSQSPTLIDVLTSSRSRRSVSCSWTASASSSVSRLSVTKTAPAVAWGGIVFAARNDRTVELNDAQFSMARNASRVTIGNHSANAVAKIAQVIVSMNVGLLHFSEDRLSGVSCLNVDPFLAPNETADVALESVNTSSGQQEFLQDCVPLAGSYTQVLWLQVHRGNATDNAAVQMYVGLDVAESFVENNTTAQAAVLTIYQCVIQTSDDGREAREGSVVVVLPLRFSLHCVAPSGALPAGSIAQWDAPDANLLRVTLLPQAVSPTPNTTSQNGVSVPARAVSAQGVTTVIVAVIGDPVVAAQANRLALALLLLVCDFSDGPLPFYASPLGLSIGSSGLSYVAGAVVGNIVIVVAFVLLQLLSALVFHFATKKSWVRSLAAARCPSLAVFPVMFLQQPVISSGVTLLMHGDDAGLRVIGGAGLVVSMLPFVAVNYYIRGAHKNLSAASFPCVYDPDHVAKEAAARGVSAVSALSRASVFFFGGGKWKDIHRSLRFKQRCQFLFADYTDKCAYFLLAEMAMNFACGVAQGLIYPGMCKSLLFVTAAFVVLFAALAVWMRPFASQFQLCYSVCSCLLQLINLCLSLAAVQFGVTDAYEMAVQATIVSVYAILIQVAVGLWPKAERLRKFIAALRRIRTAMIGDNMSLSTALLVHSDNDRDANPLLFHERHGDDDDDNVSLDSIATLPARTEGDVALPSPPPVRDECCGEPLSHASEEEVRSAAPRRLQIDVRAATLIDLVVVALQESHINITAQEVLTVLHERLCAESEASVLHSGVSYWEREVLGSETDASPLVAEIVARLDMHSAVHTADELKETELVADDDEADALSPDDPAKFLLNWRTTTSPLSPTSAAAFLPLPASAEATDFSTAYLLPPSLETVEREVDEELQDQLLRPAGFHS